MPALYASSTSAGERVRLTATTSSPCRGSGKRTPTGGGSIGGYGITAALPLTPPLASRLPQKLPSALALPNEAGELYRARLRIAEALPVVVEAPADHLHRLDAVVHFGNADGAGGLARHLLVGEEVMPQPLDQPLRDVGDVAQASVGQIVLEYRHDLVVCFVAVDHAH